MRSIDFMIFSTYATSPELQIGKSRVLRSEAKPVILEKKEERTFLLSSQSFLLAFFNVYDLAAIVLTAGLASTMGHAECAAVGALYDAGDSELPCGRTSLITSLS